MAIVFDADSRKAISRRVLKIPQENESFDLMMANMTAAADTYSKVDAGNKVFFDNYLSIVDSYEAEAVLKVGSQYSTFADWEDEILKAGHRDPTNFFFPTVAPFHMYNYPQVVGECNGEPISYPTAGYEFRASDTSGLLDCIPSTVSPSGDGIAQIIGILTVGFSYGASGTSLSAGYTVGSGSMAVVNTSGFVAGQLILAAGGASSGIFSLTAITPTVPPAGVLTVYEVSPPSGDLPLASSVVESFAGFTEAERLSGVATNPLYQDILSYLEGSVGNGLLARVNEWLLLLNAQLVALSSNSEVRAAQVAQNTAAAAEINTLVGDLTAWLAIPGLTKFSDANLTVLSGYASTRASGLAGRATQIATALGGVQDLSGSFGPTGAADAIYYKRYQLLDTRLNIVYGSLMKAITSTASMGVVSDLKNNNLFLQAEYDAALKVSKLAKDAEGTFYVTIEDGSDFSNGDNVYIVSEEVAEMAATIQNKSGNVVKLNVVVPATYKVEDLARILREVT